MKHADISFSAVVNGGYFGSVEFYFVDANIIDETLEVAIGVIIADPDV